MSWVCMCMCACLCLFVCAHAHVCLCSFCYYIKSCEAIWYIKTSSAECDISHGRNFMAHCVCCLMSLSLPVQSEGPASHCVLEWKLNPAMTLNKVWPEQIQIQHFTFYAWSRILNLDHARRIHNRVFACLYGIKNIEYKLDLKQIHVLQFWWQEWHDNFSILVHIHMIKNLLKGI